MSTKKGKTIVQKQPEGFKMAFSGFRILELSFKAKKPPVEVKNYTFQTDIEIGFGVDEQENTLEVLLGVSEKKKNAPYNFLVRSVGRFHFDELPDSKSLENFALINCPAMIFPYLRETVADMTRRSGYPPLHLNPVNFVELSSRMVQKAPKKKAIKKRVLKKRK